MRCVIIAFTLCFQFVAAGCADYRVVVARGHRSMGPLPKGTPFRMILGHPPKDALLVGKAMFHTTSFHAEEVFNEVREKARRIGGNLVAGLGCQLSDHYSVPVEGESVEGKPGGKHDRIYCTGKVYFLAPPLESPGRQRPTP